MTDRTENTVRVLLVGPLPIQGDHLGGAKAAFRQMVEDVSALPNVETRIINLSRPFKHSGRFKRLFLNVQKFVTTIFHIGRLGRGYEVWAINISPAGSLELLPFIQILARVYSKPVVVRMFGGNLDAYLEGLNPITRNLSVWSLRGAAVLALETQYLVEKLKDLSNVNWFPNTRNCIEPPRKKIHCRRFIFLSQIRHEKGVAEILDASAGLRQGVTVHFYGSVVEPVMEKRISTTKNVEYMGELQPEMVTKTLLEYDALVLPSYWEGEGHPGVVIEAFQCGLPVIATHWRQIPEIVSDDKNGILVPIKDSARLAQAMNQFVQDDLLYKRLCEGSIEAGEQLRSTRWHGEFINWCQDAIRLKQNN